ncbi:MAG: tRNA (adenosine(37)-N6)-threonylcarbamoyltransferase complex dimerization subunit type 1 TsaB [Brachymonas sp.]|nr:tRNA (adenosine(37)-N6)-threonylcarbamoyltransferase complex dimerization subunit type 1 TsaB [Brachymonas sp.]
MKLLALDTSTDTLSIAVQHGDAVLAHTSAGGALASSTLIPAIEALMQQAGLHYAQLDAIAFGLGPGSFTGLRTACAVVQGLAFGANVPVLPVDTLMIVAEEARFLAQEQGLDSTRVLGALDARMSEVYVNHYEFSSTPRSIYAGEMLKKPQNMLLEHLQMPTLLAGNIRPTLDAQLPPEAAAVPYLNALPTATALLRLAPALIAAGGLTDAEHALPLYIRDKVAQTTAERMATALSHPVASA